MVCGMLPTILPLIHLIPESSSPSEMSDFHPISLTRVIAKVMSKVNLHRLQHVLLDLISPQQCAFFKGRYIYLIVYIAHEIAPYFHTRNGNKTANESLKLDMSKAYDILELNFIRKCYVRWVLAASRFLELWELSSQFLTK